jgi:hypothetical protein
VFHEFLSSFVLVNYGRSVKAFWILNLIT